VAATVAVPLMLYLLHFSSPLGDPSRPRMSARHYLGWAPDTDWRARISLHHAGHGAAITRAAVAAGIDLQLVRLWPDEDRTTERRLKRAGHFADRHCPRCQAQVSAVALGSASVLVARRRLRSSSSPQREL
jgi:hypothetical protein